ncbi:MAG: transcriptional repressor [Ruminococcus sp.]|nr:transcriptional repressor [Ruminococcus sp.]
MKRESGYNTKQKEKLLDFLISNKDKHTNVQQISAFLTAEGTPVGTATIYRQLDKLVESGVVRKYTIDGKTGACYQYIDDTQDCKSHFHLKCVCCDRLFHITCDHLKDIDKHIHEHHGFRVDPSKTVFYGVCADCQGESSDD